MEIPENRDGYQLIPNLSDSKCFGCGNLNTSGLQMRFYINEKKDSVASWLTVPEHVSGWSNLTHGGIITTMLDETMGWAALILFQTGILSKSITVDFLKPVIVGNEIKIEGSLLEKRNDTEAIMQGFIYNNDNIVCAKSTCVVKLLSEFKLPEIIDKKIYNDIMKIIKKRQNIIQDL